MMVIYDAHHTAWDATIDGTRFICLDQLGGPPSKAAGTFLDVTPADFATA